MSAESQMPSDERSTRSAEDRKRERRKRALGANPDVPSPESGDTSDDEEAGTGGP